MPDREFDPYLSLLLRLLRLKPGQRDAIADELRDHLEERLGELTAAGVSRDDAVRRALDEFGDAASLASRFTHLSLRKTRRLIMRWTFGTTLLALLATAFWPQEPGVPAPPVANAQFGGGFGPKTKPARPAVRGRTANSAQTAEFEKKLAQPLKDVGWEDVDIASVFASIGKEIKSDIVIDKTHFEDAGYDVKTKVTLVVGYAKISARTALELVLERAGMDDVAITNRDGLIFLTSPENDRSIVVYNCRDMLQAAVKNGVGADAPNAPGQVGGGFFSVQAAGLGAPGGGGLGGRPARPLKPKSPLSAAAQALMNVIQATVRSTQWVANDGEGAEIAEFNGLLVITASNKAHRDIQLLLEKMRDANQQRALQPKPNLQPKPKK